MKQTHTATQGSLGTRALTVGVITLVVALAVSLAFLGSQFP